MEAEREGIIKEREKKLQLIRQIAINSELYFFSH